MQGFGTVSFFELFKERRSEGADLRGLLTVMFPASKEGIREWFIVI